MQKLGDWAEDYALKFLQQQGYMLVEKNYYCMYGEIDLIVQKNNTLVFVEVKARSSKQYGTAIEMVTLSKQKKIIKTAMWFLQEHEQFELYDCRFDVVAMQMVAKNLQDIKWIENAFTLG